MLTDHNKQALTKVDAAGVTFTQMRTRRQPDGTFRCMVVAKGQGKTRAFVGENTDRNGALASALQAIAAAFEVDLSPTVEG